MPKTRKPKAKVSVATSHIELSGTVSVDYVANQMHSVTLRLDGFKPALVMLIDVAEMSPDAVDFRHPDGTALVSIDGDEAADVVREIGLYVAHSAGLQPPTRETLL